MSLLHTYIHLLKLVNNNSFELSKVHELDVLVTEESHTVLLVISEVRVRARTETKYNSHIGVLASSVPSNI